MYKTYSAAIFAAQLLFVNHLKKINTLNNKQL